jgi:predicted amidophosphoribosyltransferase
MPQGKCKQYDMENDILHSTPAPSAAQNNDQTRIAGQYYDDYCKEEEGNSQNAQSQFYLAICPGCGSAARKEDKFCSQCGLGLWREKCVQCNFINTSDIFLCLLNMRVRL